MKGKTNEEIAEIVGIGVRTLYDWKVEDWEFSAALKENKDLADDVVEACSYKSATGFYYEEDASTKDGIQRIERFHPPSSSSQIWWLKNRRPKKWRDRVEVQMDMQEAEEMTGPDGTVVTDDR